MCYDDDSEALQDHQARLAHRKGKLNHIWCSLIVECIIFLLFLEMDNMCMVSMVTLYKPEYVINIIFNPANREFIVSGSSQLSFIEFSFAPNLFLKVCFSSRYTHI